MRMLLTNTMEAPGGFSCSLNPNVIIDRFGYLLHLACCFGQSNELIKGQQFVFQFFADWCAFWGSLMLQ